MQLSVLNLKEVFIHLEWLTKMKILTHFYNYVIIVPNEFLKYYFDIASLAVTCGFYSVMKTLWVSLMFRCVLTNVIMHIIFVEILSFRVF